MTNEQVRAAFSEVYNDFWNRYKNQSPPKDSQEWERMQTFAVVLMRKYPFMREVIAAMVEELDQRMRRQEENDCKTD